LQKIINLRNQSIKQSINQSINQFIQKKQMSRVRTCILVDSTLRSEDLPPHWRVFRIDQRISGATVSGYLKKSMPGYYTDLNEMIDARQVRHLEKINTKLDLKTLFGIRIAWNEAGDRPTFDSFDFFKYEADRDAFFEKYTARLDRILAL